MHDSVLQDFHILHFNLKVFFSPQETSLLIVAYIVIFTTEAEIVGKL